MFGDFNFSSGFSQLASIDISQKFEQIKKDLEANISSHIDHDALAAFTGEGAKGGNAHFSRWRMRSCLVCSAMTQKMAQIATEVFLHIFRTTPLIKHAQWSYRILRASLHAASEQQHLSLWAWMDAITYEDVDAGEDIPASSQPAGNPVPGPGTGINPASLTAPEQEGFASSSQPQSEQSASASAHPVPIEPHDHGTAPAASPRQRSLRHPRSPRSPAAQRRANARSKPDTAEKLSIRRLGAEPIGKKASTDSAASLPVVIQTDDADRVKVSFASLDESRQEPGLSAYVNGDAQHDSHRPHEKQLQDTADPADAASTFGIR